MTTCFETTIAGYTIKLDQTSVDEFTVTYGLQVKAGLEYWQAAQELGSCLMHAAACEGKLTSEPDK